MASNKLQRPPVVSGGSFNLGWLDVLNLDKLNLDIRNLNTIGKKRASVLNKLGIFTLYDLISYFPRTYEDRRSFRDIADLAQDSMCCIRACVISVPQVTFIRRGMELLRFRVADDTGSLYITFFNQSYLKNSIKSGKTYCFYGKVSPFPMLVAELLKPIFRWKICEKERNRKNISTTNSSFVLREIPHS